MFLNKSVGYFGETSHNFDMLYLDCKFSHNLQAVSCKTLPIKLRFPRFLNLPLGPNSL